MRRELLGDGLKTGVFYMQKQAFHVQSAQSPRHVEPCRIIFGAYLKHLVERVGHLYTQTERPGERFGRAAKASDEKLPESKKKLTQEYSLNVWPHFVHRMNWVDASSPPRVCTCQTYTVVLSHFSHFI